MKRVFISVLAVAWAAPARAQDAQIEKMVEELEKLAPSAEDDPLVEMVDAYDAVSVAIRTSSLADDRKAELQRRADAAQDHYCVEGAKLAGDDGDQAFWILRPLLKDRFRYDRVSDAALLLLRSSNQARNGRAERNFADNGSYAAGGKGGNAVVSTEPFIAGAESVNKGVSYYHAGDNLTWHIRFYSKQDLSDYAGEEGHFKAILSVNSFTSWSEPAGAPQSHKPGERTVDATFDFPRKPLDEDDLAMLTAELRFFWVKERVMEDGKLTPVWESKQVSSSTFLWEKKPK